MTSSQKNYDELFQLSRHISTLHSIESLLHWDQETYMPQDGGDYRSQQLEALSGIIHKEATSPNFSKALGKLVNLETGEVLATDLSAAQQAALREWHRDWKRSHALPNAFVKKFSKLTSASILAWRKAKDDDDFELFAPYLEQIISMSRQKADYLGWTEHPYDALVDLYEHDISTKEITRLFNQIRKPIHDLIQQITGSKQVKDDFLHGRFPQAKQLEFSNLMLKNMGYNFESGRLDISAHPFSTEIAPGDNRITTRIHPSCVLSNLLVVMHECGHSLYSGGLPKEQFGSPLGQPISMGMHECQSRFWETRIGQSKPYWKHYLPLLKEAFKGKFDNVTVDAFYRAVNKVEPSFIRVDADEVTYPLHIILRFEMEKALIEGSLKVKDVPQVWNAKMQELLGITPKNNREGCLQDIHWAMGGFGYFPSYSLGTIYASHLFTALEKEYPDWETRVAKGELIFIKDWLNKSVYQYGRRYSSLELLKKITGKKLTSDAFIQYLTTKYSNIYRQKI